MIARVFRATVKPGKQKDFKSFFINYALPLIKKQEGIVDVIIGLPIDKTSQEFMMTSIWDNVESIKKFAGIDWRKAIIDEREKHLLKHVSIDHYTKFE